MKRYLELMVLLASVALLAGAVSADTLTIKDGSTATVTLSDGSTIQMKFSVASDGTITWIGALGRDQWFSPAVNGGAPDPTPIPPIPVPVGPVITTKTLPNAICGKMYAAELAATGGSGARTWSVIAGALPGGVTLLPAGGLAGIPTAAGISEFTLACTDSAGVSARATLHITVTDEPAPPTPSKLRVVILYDADSLAAMPEPQRQMLSDTRQGGLRAWLSDHALTSADGVPEWRCWSIGSKCEESRFEPLVAAGGGKTGIVVQRGEGGPISRVDLPAGSPAAIAALTPLASPRGPPRLHVIDESNYPEVLGRNNGYVKGTVPKGMPKFRSVYPLIPRSQWSALIAEGKGTWLGDLIRAAKIPCKDQDGLGYCWVYASTSCVEAIRALQGQPLVVLSPESVGGPVTGWRNQGGWGYDALEQLTKAGACRADFMDKPNSLRPSRWKDGWEADCANHKITAAWATIDDDDFDGVMTAALLRLPVSIGLDFWSHQVVITGPVDLGNGKYGVEFLNSWGSSYGTNGFDVLSESKAQPSGSFACISVGTSDKALNATQRGTAADLVRLRQKSVAKIIAQYQMAN
jgi:hypothetical protein